MGEKLGGLPQASHISVRFAFIKQGFNSTGLDFFLLGSTGATSLKMEQNVRSTNRSIMLSLFFFESLAPPMSTYMSTKTKYRRQIVIGQKEMMYEDV